LALLGNQTENFLSTPNGLTHPQTRTLSPSLQPLTLIARRKAKRETLWTWTKPRNSACLQHSGFCHTLVMMSMRALDYSSNN